MATLTAAQRLAVYGPLVTYPGGGRGVAATALRTVTSPWGLKARVHHLVADHWLATATAAAVEVPEFRPGRCDSFAPRAIRGSTSTSLHAYGLADDWFITPLAAGPPAGGVWDPYELRTPEYRAWCAVWARWGWRLGASFARVDTPHIEWAQQVPGPEHRPAPPPVPAPPPAPEEDDPMARFPIDLEAGPPGPGGLVPIWRLTGPDGGIQALNGAPFYGSLPSIGVQRSDAVGIVRREDRHGYTVTTEGIWLDPADGQWKTATYSLPR